ncbi:MAG: hypothetical protein BMS9Abin31_0488 [Gammaproteobacteria bacterium]|nr:MAG: hypothetical protein BMS9Abin31_0488 [Gammaproteobacteria bacterium]
MKIKHHIDLTQYKVDKKYVDIYREAKQYIQELENKKLKVKPIKWGV